MKNKKLVEITLLMCSMYTMMAGAIVAPSLPLIHRVFSNLDNIDILSRLILSLPALFTAIFAPVFGLLSDKYGRKKLLLFSLILYAIGGSLGYFIEEIYIILIGRGMLGISVAGIMTLSAAYIGDYYSGSERSKYLGLQGAFMGFGGVIFISLAGVLADIQWNYPFLIYFLSLITFVTAWVSIKNSATVIVSQDTLNPVICKSSEVFKIYIFIFLGILFFYMIPVQLPFLLSQSENMSNTKIGLVIASMQLTSAIVPLFYKKIKQRYSFDFIYILVLFFLGFGFVMVGYFHSFILILCAVAVSGIGVGLLMPLGNMWIMSIAPINKRGSMVGNITTSVFLAQFLSPLLFYPFIDKIGINCLFLISGCFLIVFSILYFFSLNYLNKFLKNLSVDKRVS